MRPVSASTTIDAPRERVFDLLCDLGCRPAFTDHFFTDLRLGRVDPVGVGASARFRIGDSNVWLDTVIEQVERTHLLRESGHGGRLNRVPVFTVWELAEGPSPSSSEVTVTFWTEPRTLPDKLRDLRHGARRLRRDWKRGLRRLRALAEQGGSPPRVEVAGADRLPVYVP